MPDRPLVRVGPYGVMGDWERATCSVCGVLGDVVSPAGEPDDVRVDALKNRVWRHAMDIHAGDVYREGWT